MLRYSGSIGSTFGFKTNKYSYLSNCYLAPPFYSGHQHGTNYVLVLASMRSAQHVRGTANTVGWLAVDLPQGKPHTNMQCCRPECRRRQQLQLHQTFVIRVKIHTVISCILSTLCMKWTRNGDVLESFLTVRSNITYSRLSNIFWWKFALV